MRPMIDLKEFMQAHPEKCVNQECMVCYGWAGISRYWKRIRTELEQQQEPPPRKRTRKRKI